MTAAEAALLAAVLKQRAWDERDPLPIELRDLRTAVMLERATPELKADARRFFLARAEAEQNWQLVQAKVGVDVMGEWYTQFSKETKR